MLDFIPGFLPTFDLCFNRVIHPPPQAKDILLLKHQVCQMLRGVGKSHFLPFPCFYATLLVPHIAPIFERI